MTIKTSDLPAILEQHRLWMLSEGGTCANLYGADLRGANLRGADLGNDQIVTINPVFFTGGTWPVMITDKHIKIGCEVHPTEAWEGFSDRKIAAMDGTNASRFWRLWKDTIMTMAKAHQSQVGETEK